MGRGGIGCLKAMERTRGTISCTSRCAGKAAVCLGSERTLIGQVKASVPGQRADANNISCTWNTE